MIKEEKKKMQVTRGREEDKRQGKSENVGENIKRRA